MTTPRTTTTATAFAVAVLMATAVACTTGQGATDGRSEASALGLTFPLPAGFERSEVGTEERPRDMEALWVGPRGDDTTSAGISAVRLCEQPLPTWQEVTDLAEDGDHTGWTSYRLAGPPETVDVEGALTALLVRGTYQLEVAATGAEGTVLHHELLVHSAPDVIHQFSIEGTPGALAEVPVDELLAAVRVTSTGCPA